MCPLSVRVSVSIALTCTLSAGGFWDKRSFLDWSQEQVTRLLTRSPWAAVVQVTLTPALPAAQSQAEGCACCGTGSVFEDVFAEGGEIDPEAGKIPRRVASASDLMVAPGVARRYAIRFVTAKPIRMAFARLGVLTGRGGPEDARQFVAGTTNPDAILVSLSVLDGDPSELDLPVESLGENVYLSLKPSQRTVAADRYIGPTQTGRGEAIIIFPRLVEGLPTVDAREKEVALVFHLGGVKIEKKFKLKDMLFEGQLEL